MFGIGISGESRAEQRRAKRSEVSEGGEGGGRREQGGAGGRRRGRGSGEVVGMILRGCWNGESIALKIVNNDRSMDVRT